MSTPEEALSEPVASEPVQPVDPEPQAENTAETQDSLRARLERARQKKREFTEAQRHAVKKNLEKGRAVIRENQEIRKQELEIQTKIREREKTLKVKELQAREAELARREAELDDIIGRALRREVKVQDTPKYREATPEERPQVVRQYGEAVARNQTRKLIDFF